MQLSEREIEDLIFDDLVNNDGHTLQVRGLDVPSLGFFQHWKSNPKILWKRQLNIEPYGILDIVGFYRYKGNLFADLMELKACPIDATHFDQIFRYKKGLEVYIQNTFNSVRRIEVNCVLIGTGYNAGHYIQNNSEIRVSEYRYDLNGIDFNTHRPFTNWTKTNDDHCTFRSKVSANKHIKTNGKAIHGY